MVFENNKFGKILLEMYPFTKYRKFQIHFRMCIYKNNDEILKFKTAFIFNDNGPQK